MISLYINNKIYFWQIGYKSKSITKINELSDINGIFNFSVISSKSLLTVSKHVVNTYEISSLALIS